MIDVGSTDFYIRFANLPPGAFRDYSNRLFDLWEARVAQELALEDYALVLEIEEGSVKGSGKIKTTLKAVGVVICGYGSLMQGLQYIRSHASNAGDYLGAMAHEVLGPSAPSPSITKRSGTIGQLERLFIKVHRREMSVDEAISRAKELIGDDAGEAPEFMDRLTESLRHTQLHPEQTSLPFADLDEAQPTEENRRHQVPKPRRHTPVIPSSNQLRVEIWKDSKRGKKKIKVINLR